MNKLISTLVLLGGLFLVYKLFVQPKMTVAEVARNGKVITVAEMQDNTREFEGKNVTVEGEVTNSGSMIVGGYTIDDGTGKIWVVTTKAVPNKGIRMKVSGVLSQVAKIGKNAKLTLTEQ
ncbi:MAG: hypothetical protein ACKVTZ_13165 [Bacteroidia bacterium]